MLFEEKFNTTVSYNIACVVYMKRKPGGKHAVIKKKINHKASYISFKTFWNHISQLSSQINENNSNTISIAEKEYYQL